MNNFYFACIIGFAAFVTVQAQAGARCAGINDTSSEPHQFGCYSFSYCLDEIEITETCPNGTVFERDTMSCQDELLANTGCGKEAECNGRDDGIHGDPIPCQTFYWCIGGQYLEKSRQYCAAETVWDSDKGYCNYPYAVPQPCGTAAPAPPAPVEDEAAPPSV